MLHLIGLSGINYSRIMQVVPKSGFFILFNNSLINSTSSTSSSSLARLASFHSTPISFEKWKKKWIPDVRGHTPSKSYIKYKTRQKRADAKKALNNLLFNSGCSNAAPSKFVIEADHSDSSDKKGRSKSSARRADKACHKKKKHKYKRQDPFDDMDEHPETLFQKRFGVRWCTWSFRDDSSTFRNRSTEFEWVENPNAYTRRNREWDTSSGNEFEVKSSCFIGSSSQRTLLGLPTKGPLTLEDVKNAFRLSALKWHPDKHQGPSQALAEEKFKDCVNAYKSICSALSTA